MQKLPSSQGLSTASREKWQAPPRQKAPVALWQTGGVVQSPFEAQAGLGTSSQAWSVLQIWVRVGQSWSVAQTLRQRSTTQT